MLGLLVYASHNQLRQLAVKFILRRHCLDAETMPYALKWMGVSTVLDLGLAATIASTELYLREGNTVEELTLEHPDPNTCNVRQQTIVCEPLRIWTPYVPFDHLVRALAQNQGPIPAKLRCLKQCILEGMIRAAQHPVAQKVEAEGWAGGISFGWLVKLSRVKRSWCNGICRFTILRWALNQDDDVWLSLRGTRHNRPCQLCGQLTDICPIGFWHSPICESCIRSHAITPACLYPDSSALFDLYRQEARTEANIHQTSARIVHSYFHANRTDDSGEAPQRMRVFALHCEPTSS